MAGAHPERLSQPLSATLLAAAVAVIIAAGVVLLAPIVWSAVVSGLPDQPPGLAQCATIATNTERLACYDVLGKEALRPPAKGANAPLISR